MAQNFMTRSSEWNQLRTLEVVAVAELTYHPWCPLHLQHQYLSLQTMVMQATRTKITGDGGTTGDGLSFQAVLWKFQRKRCCFLLMLVSIYPIKCKLIIFDIGNNNRLTVMICHPSTMWDITDGRIQGKKSLESCEMRCNLMLASFIRVVYKSRQPAKFTDFSARFHQLLSLLQESRRWTDNFSQNSGYVKI